MKLSILGWMFIKQRSLSPFGIRVDTWCWRRTSERGRKSFFSEVVARQIRTTKTRLAEAISKNVMEILQYGEESVSVAMEEIKPQD